MWTDWIPSTEHNLNQRRSFEGEGLHLAEKNGVMYNKLRFLCFLCWYNYVLLVSCWISFFLCLLSSCSFSYVNSSISSQHTAVSLYGHIFFRKRVFNSIKVEFLILSQESSSSYIAHRLVTHTSIEWTIFNSTECFYFLKKDFIGFIIVLLVVRRSLSQRLFYSRWSMLHQLIRYIQEPQRNYNEISFESWRFRLIHKVN